MVIDVFWNHGNTVHEQCTQKFNFKIRYIFKDQNSEQIRFLLHRFYIYIKENSISNMSSTVKGRLS